MSLMQTPPSLPLVHRGQIRHHSTLLVQPFYPKDRWASYGKHVLTPALTMPALAGATPQGWSVDFWDENLLQGPPPLDPSALPQVVGITVHLTFAHRAYALAAWFRAHGCTVILGGLHAKSCPEEVAPHADAIAIGEGTATWPQILHDIDAGCLRPRYEAAMVGYREQAPPDRSILPRWAYLTPHSVIATQGCKNRCDFCYLATGDERVPYQSRRPEDVVAELEGVSYAVFIDNNLGANRGYLRRLCKALAPLDTIWSAAVTLDVTDDPTLIREMALAGCTGVFIGFESLSDENVRSMGKRSPRTPDYARRVRLFHEHGIQVNGSFVLGFDHDHPDCFGQLLRWVEDARLECATYHILTPYPGTPLFAQMKAEGRLLHSDWRRYDTAHCVFKPTHMSPEQLEAGYQWLYRETFTLRSIWARRPAAAPAVAPYLAMSMLYKRSNPLWQRLISHRLTNQVWSPLVELTRIRHLRYRSRLARRSAAQAPPAGGKLRVAA